MQRESPELARLQQLDPALAARYEGLRVTLDGIDRSQRLGASPSLSAEIASIAEEMQSVIEEIRALPSLERFLEILAWDEIAGAASPKRPLVYVLTAPQSSVALLVWRDSSPEVEVVEGRVTSTDIASLLFKLDPGGVDAGGYFLAPGRRDGRA